MQIRYRIALAATAFVFLTATPAAAQNVLVNGDFEFGDLTGWELFGAGANATATVLATDNGPSAPGTHHVFLENRQDGLSLTLKQSSVAGSAGPGNVDYSFDLLLGEAALGGVFFVEIFAEQADGGVIGGSGLLGNYTPAQWTNFSGSFEAPTGTDFLTIQFSAITGANIGSVSTMRVDNVVLSQNPVSNDETQFGKIKSLYR